MASKEVNFLLTLVKKLPPFGCTVLVKKSRVFNLNHHLSIQVFGSADPRERRICSTFSSREARIFFLRHVHGVEPLHAMAVARARRSAGGHPRAPERGADGLLLPGLPLRLPGA